MQLSSGSRSRWGCAEHSSVRKHMPATRLGILLLCMYVCAAGIWCDGSCLSIGRL